MSGSIFKREAYQYDHADVKLLIYLDKYKDDWELRSTVRRDTMLRVEQGMPVKKVVHVRKPKAMEVSHRQLELILLAMNTRRAFNTLSRDVLLAIDEVEGGFNSGDVALAMFGPSDKPYERGKNQQNVKRMIRKLEYHNVLMLDRMKYRKLPVWSPLIVAVQDADKRKRFERSIQW